jgi:cell division protease FtsH
VKLIIEESYQRAQEVLKSNLKGLIELAELLLEKEVIFSEDLERIFGKRKADILKEERELALKQETPGLPATKEDSPKDPVVIPEQKSEKISGKSKKASGKASSEKPGEKANRKK